MRLLSLKEISAMEKGEIIPSARFQVKEVKDVKAGENAYGPYTIQQLTALDSTGVAKVKLFDSPNVYDAQWVGVWVQVESTPDASGKLRGVMVDSYKDAKEIAVKFKNGARMEQATDLAPEPAPAKPAAPTPRAAAPVAAVRPAPVKPLAAGGSPSQALPIKAPEPQKDGVTEAKKKLGQMANAMILSYDCALFIADQVQARNENVVIPLFSPDILEKIAVSMCIELARSGLIMGLPTGPLPAKKPALPPSQMDEPPEDWQPEEP